MIELDEAPISTGKMAKERFAKVPYTMKKVVTFITDGLRECDRYTPSHSQAKLANTELRSWIHNTTEPDVRIEA